MKRKWLSLLLAVAMVLGMMPAAVFAATPATAYVRIVGPANVEFVPYKAVEIEDGVTTLAELTNKAVVTSGSAVTLNDWGFISSIDGCDIGSDSWMSMLNDSGDAFNTDNFNTVKAKDGDCLVLYPYGNGNYAWINAAEKKDVDIMEYEGWEYITGSGYFQVSYSGYDESWNPVTGPLEGAEITVTGPEKAELGEYDVSAKTLTTDGSGCFDIDFWGNCSGADLDTYEQVYEIRASKDGTNTAFCLVTLTKDGLTFSQPEGAIEVPLEPLDKPTADMEDLINHIASRYVEASSLNDWQVMEMSAYEAYAPNSPYKLKSAVEQNYVNAAVAAAKKSPAEADVAKMIIALQAAGYDPQALYEKDSADPFSLTEMLDGMEHSADAWTAAYTMAAYAQNSATKDAGKAIAADVLKTQNDDGSFEAWGSKIDATANMIAGLAFYADDAEVKAAIDKAVEYLASAQLSNGTFDSWGYGPDANTAAIVVIGLSAAGVDPAKDSRFIKDGFSALDGLLVYALEDNSGFGYQDNATINDSATEQGFRALLAAANAAKTGKAFNIYDYSANKSLKPAKASGADESSSPADPTGDDITVKVSVKSLEGYWLRNYSLTVPGDGATAYYVLTKAFDKNNITYKSKNGGYIYELTYDGTTLGEFDGGPNSGWLYKVNSKLPTVSTPDYNVKNGDVILFYYTEDWTKDPDAASNAGIKPDAPAVAETKQTFIDVEASDWYSGYADKAAEEGLFAGYPAGKDAEGNEQYEFRGKETMTRAMFVTVLRALNVKLNGETAAAPDAGFADVPEGAWYEEAVNWAFANGIAAGKGENFGVDDAVTREQMAVFLYAYARSAGKVKTEPDLSKLDAFTDADRISGYAREAMAWLVGEGLMAGRGNDTLAPAESSTRAEVAAFMIGCLEYLK